MIFFKRGLRRLPLLALALVAGMLWLAVPLAVAPTQPAQADPAVLQRVFAAAAREFGVPDRVLLAVSYNLTRWEHHGGAIGMRSTSAGRKHGSTIPVGRAARPAVDCW